MTGHTPSGPGGPGQSGHVDTETLSEHAEGLLPAADDARVRTHLAFCDDCRTVVDQLAGVRSMLAALPAPAMPDDVAARLDATLARVQQERADLTPARGTPGGAGGRNGAGGRRRSRFTEFLLLRPQVLAGAAVAVVAVAAIGGYALVRGGPGSDGNQAGTQPPQPTSSTAPTGGSAAAPIASGRTYSDKNMQREARLLVRDASSGTFSPNPSQSKVIGDEIRRLEDPDVFAGCANAVTGGDIDRVVAADLGQYKGTPAAVVVMTLAGHPDEYQVAIVGPGCSAQDAHVLHRTTVAR